MRPNSPSDHIIWPTSFMCHISIGSLSTIGPRKSIDYKSVANRLKPIHSNCSMLTGFTIAFIKGWMIKLEEYVSRHIWSCYLICGYEIKINPPSPPIYYSCINIPDAFAALFNSSSTLSNAVITSSSLLSLYLLPVRKSCYPSSSSFPWCFEESLLL